MDLAFEAINSNGKFQKVLSLIIIMIGSITLFITISLPFMSKSPKMLCREKDFDQLPFMPCGEHNYCQPQLFDYKVDDKNSLNNFALSFHLYCDKSYYLAIIGTAFFLGGMTGSFVLSPIPDLYGRAGIYKFLCVCSILCQLNALFSMGPIHFAITAFAAGIIAYSYSMSMLLITEFLDRNTSGIIMSLNNAVFPASGIFIALCFLFINNWRFLFLITTILSCIIAYLVFNYIVESPRWLNSKNRIVDCIDSLKQIAKINGTLENYNKFLEANKLLINHSVSNFQETKKSMGLIQIFKLKSIRIKLFCLLYIWFSSGACFYGLILNIEHLGGNIFVDSILTFGAEITAELLSGWCADVYGRKIVMEMGCIVGGVSFILYDLLDKSTLKTIMIFCTSFGFSSTFNVIFIYSPEAMPTSVRSTVMGILYLVSRIGAMLVPTLLRVINHPPIIFGLLSLIAAYLVTFLEETLGTELSDDVLELKRSGSFFSSSRRLLELVKRGSKIRQSIVSETYFKTSYDKLSQIK